ncbi:MAG: peptide deformylase [Candidatus Melainabacteria bacterium GWF2_37_15]|nr:MAG: peptide deformylase [Candidatus Melainabacteria bacterium GWF2_37_15]
MTVLKILTYGNEVLRTPSKEVHKVSVKIQKIVDDLFDTMYSYDNGIGLAAPQIGYNYRIFVLDLAKDGEPPNPAVFINPKIIKKWGALSSFEGCLSFPDVYTYVRRYENIIVKAQNLKGRSFTLEAKNGSLLSRAIQHEYDHLEGILFVDHARSRFETDKLLAEKGLPQINSDYLMEEEELEKEILEKGSNSIQNEDNIPRDTPNCC